MKKLFPVLVILFLSITQMAYAAPGRGQVEVSDVTASMKGTIITIRYNIAFGTGVMSCNTRLQISVDDGKSFSDVAHSSAIKGEIGHISSAGSKEITYDIEAVKSQYWDKPIRFNIAVSGVNAVYPGIPVMAGATVYPSLSYNVMAGYVSKFGVFVKVKSDFSNASPTANYTCTSSGSTGQGYIWATGQEKHSMLSVSVGGMMRVAKFLYPYIGVGYGKRSIVWQDSESKWVEVSDLTYKGIVVDGGLMFKFGKFLLQAGCSNLGCAKGFGVDAGVGWIF